jgi:predicted transcriptional regulator
MIREEELVPLIREGKSGRQIADVLDCSQGNVKHYLKKYGLRTEAVYYKKEHRCGCGETRKFAFVLAGNGKRSKTKCKKCHSRYTVDRFRRYKLEAVAYKGGKCEKCGYGKCAGSLHFHHKDSSQKDIRWRQMRTWCFDKLKPELDKCVLLCANCHGEIHWLAT